MPSQTDRQTYLVAWDDDPDKPRPRGTFSCEAANPAEAAAAFERSLHARALPREQVEVSVYESGQDPAQAPASDSARTRHLIEAAPFRVRFGPPLADGAGRARIAVEIDGRFCGRLCEAPGAGGSGWFARSARGELDAVHGRPAPGWPTPDTEPLTLGEACRQVELLAASQRRRWRADPGWRLPAPSKTPERLRLPDPDPVPGPARFRAPVVDSEGRAFVAIELDGRPAGTLREQPGFPEGSQWVASSPRPELDGIGSARPRSLGAACAEVQRAVSLARREPFVPAPASMADKARAATAEPPQQGRCR